MPEVPIRITEAAEQLGVSRSYLDNFLRTNCRPKEHFDLRGNRKVFYRDHISRLNKAMTECACKSNGLTDGRRSTAPDLMESGSDALSKLKTLAAQNNRERR